MNNFSKLNSLLKEQAAGDQSVETSMYDYARFMTAIENVIVVVSNIKNETSKIFCGGFANTLGISDYEEENSIWEKRILSMMSKQEQEAKFIAELRFYHFLRQHVKNRNNYYMMSKLRFTTSKGLPIDVLHRMYYIYGKNTESIMYALCIYGPMTGDFKGKSVVVNSLTGICEELNYSSDSNILSNRERQVLSLVETGMKSMEIASQLNISKHTVSRHRQEILTKMQVKNSIEACRVAKSMKLI